MWHGPGISLDFSFQFIFWLVCFIDFVPAIPRLSIAHGTPSSSPQELWKPLEQNLSLVYNDDYLAVYSNPNVNHSIEWLFSPLSQAWKYTNETYGSFGSDPHLYLILQAAKYHNCASTPFTNNRHDNHNVIDCGTTDDQSNERIFDSTEILESLLSSVGYIIGHGAKGIKNDADSDICTKGMQNIVIYDIYLQLKNSKKISYEDEINFVDDNLERWKHEKKGGFQLGTFWFKDWFLPIYERFGGASALNRFYSLTHEYWKKSRGVNAYEHMNKAQFVHFWSESAGVDLSPLAKLASFWREKNQRDLVKAIKDQTFNYTSASQKPNRLMQNPPGIWEIITNDIPVNFSLAYYDGNVAFYSKSFKLYPISSLKLVSVAWKYVSEKYFKWSSPKRLYITLEDGTHETSDCSDVNASSRNGNVGNLHVIHCLQDQSAEIPSEKIVTAIALKTLKLESYGNHIISSAYNVSGWSMTSIIVYDIYLTLGQITEALEWKNKRLNESDSNGTFWFRDWYLEIYELHSGETQTKTSPVIQNFFSILRERKQRTSESGNRIIPMTHGEFLHFWSNAAESNLKRFSKSLNWEDDVKLDNEWFEARLKCPDLNYTVPKSANYYLTGVPGFNYDCSQKEDGDYPHPTKCTHYVACVGKTDAYEMSCLTGNGGKILHWVQNSGPNSNTSRCGYPEVAGCDSKWATTTQALVILPKIQVPPSDGENCNPEECGLKGDCRTYYHCNKETSKWEKHTCGTDLFWNEAANNIHGGNCDFFQNLDSDRQKKYRSDIHCILPCGWWQTDDQVCSGNYNYRVPFDNVTLLGREYALQCPSLPEEALIWVQSSLSCERCTEAKDAFGNACSCAEIFSV